MTKPRGPDRRGMGAESDFIAEQFVPSALHKAHQKAMAQDLISAGLDPEQVALLIPVDPSCGEKPDAEKPQE